MNFRKFKNTDARFCFACRSNAFIQKFYDEIGAEGVSICVNTYMPEDYILMGKEIEVFIIEDELKEIGFFTLKKTKDGKAEMPLIYFDLNEIGKGYGAQTIHFIEQWIKEYWPEVKVFFLDTIIPKYNSGFYKKMGFTFAGESQCNFGNRIIKSVHFEKTLK